MSASFSANPSADTRAGNEGKEGRGMIEVTVRDGFYLVTLPKCVLVLTKAEFIRALARGKWWKRRQAMRARIAPKE
jgi:hypothetical protein